MNVLLPIQLTLMLMLQIALLNASANCFSYILYSNGIFLQILSVKNVLMWTSSIYKNKFINSLDFGRKP